MYVYNTNLMESELSYYPPSVITKCMILTEFYKMIKEIIKKYVKILSIEQVELTVKYINTSLIVLTKFNEDKSLRKDLSSTVLGKTMKSNVPNVFHEEAVGKSTLLSIYIDLLLSNNQEYKKYEKDYKEYINII